MSEDRLRALEERCAWLEGRLERFGRDGTVADTDYSDPTAPRARIVIGIDEDGLDVLGPWVPVSMRAGDYNEWRPVSKGQQLTMVSLDGDHEQGRLIGLGHSEQIPAPETDPNTHVHTFGQTRHTLKKDSVTQTVGGVQVQHTTQDHKTTAPGKIVLTGGDPAAANSSGAGALTNFPHELNRIVQGFAARLDQHDHHHTAMHDQVSTMVDKLVGLCPALLDQQQKTLNHKPDGLKQAADEVLGMLPSYSASAIQQTLAKLLNTPLGAVAEIAKGDIAGAMNGLLGQVGSLIGGAGLTGGLAATAQMYLDQAQAAVEAAAAGGNADLDHALSGLASLASGSPIAGMLGDAIGQLRGIMGATTGLMGGLTGLLDGQVNATKGTIKSAMFGKY